MTEVLVDTFGINGKLSDFLELPPGYFLGAGTYKIFATYYDQLESDIFLDRSKLNLKLSFSRTHEGNVEFFSVKFNIDQKNIEFELPTDGYVKLLPEEGVRRSLIRPGLFIFNNAGKWENIHNLGFNIWRIVKSEAAGDGTMSDITSEINGIPLPPAFGS